MELQIDIIELKSMGLAYEEIIGYVEFYSDLWADLIQYSKPN